MLLKMSRVKTSGKGLLLIGCLAASVYTLVAQNTDYEKQIQESRSEMEKSIRSETGPLLLIGRYRVDEGKTTLGSHSKNNIVLPDRAPSVAGVIERQGEKITFTPESGTEVQLKGTALKGATVLRTGPGDENLDKLRMGDFTLIVSSRSGDCSLFVRDRQSPFLKDFKGLSWFPIDPSYKVEATYTAYPEAKSVKVPDTQGGIRQMSVPGSLTFRLKAQLLHAEVFLENGYMFLMLKDQTSGKETYGAGRYLSVPLPANGKTKLDFNEAYNPLCAMDPFISCPIVPKDNRLPIRIEAGAKYSATI